MGDPNTAALDPIFWLHHANIDRLWQVWLDTAGRENPTAGAWRAFTFKFHNAEGTPVTMAVKDAETTAQLDYEYTTSYPAPETPNPVRPVSRRADASMDVVGASTQSTDLADTPVSVNLNMVPAPMRNATLKAAAKSGTDKKTILRINNIKGEGDVPPINVFVNSKSAKEDDDAHFVGSIGLFGLGDASTPGVESDGGGLSFSLDASNVINQLRKAADWDEDNISVQLVPQAKLDAAAKVNIGRVSLHSECVD